MNRLVLGCGLAASLAAGCAGSSAPQKTQLQLREFQTRTYQTNDTRMVLKAIVNVLQDDGFIIKEANIELGILTATKETIVESQWNAFLSTMLEGEKAKWDKNALVEATANVSEFGAETRVRVIFQIKTMDNQGGVSKIKQIDEEKHYQDFFAKVDKGVFIQKEGL